MKNYKVQVNLVRRDNPEQLINSFTIEMTSQQKLGTVIGQTLRKHDIEADDLEYYKVEVELVEE